MSKLTDSQVIDAIDDRKQFFVKHYKTTGGKDVHETWAFNHIMTVLDHARKIFETDTDQLIEQVKTQTHESHG